jgi:hypothetical protein
MADAMTVRQARESDVPLVALNLREEDRREIQAVYAESPTAVLARGITQSEACYALTCADDSPIAIFGVIRSSRLPGVGVPWMAAGDTLSRHWLYVARNSRPWIELLQQGFDELWNCIDARNHEDLRWLEWCGFEILGPMPEYGVERRRFISFRRRPHARPAKAGRR